MKIFCKLLLFCSAIFLINFVNLTEAKGIDNTDKVIERYYINDKFNVKYPEFIIDDQKIGLDKVNNKVRSVADKFIKDLTKEDNLVTAQLGYDIHYFTDDICSFTINTYVYTGGAHGVSELKGYNYNIKTGEALSFIKMFDFRPSQINKNIFAKAKGDNLLLFDNFKGIEEYPENFYLLDAKTPIIIFQQYEIAPYSSGIIKVPIIEETEHI